MLLKLDRKDDKFDYFRTIIHFCVRCEDGFSLDAIWIVLRVEFYFNLRQYQPYCLFIERHINGVIRIIV